MADGTFGIGVGEAFLAGINGFRRNPLPLMAAALATLVSFWILYFPSVELESQDRMAEALGLRLVGFLLGSIAALPWYFYALQTARGEELDLRKPFADPILFKSQAVASFWFWAGVLFGLQLRFLAGLPAILVMLLYCFYGFLIADRRAVGGMAALGTSVRLGDGKRIGLMGLGVLFLAFNLIGMAPVSSGITIPGFLGAAVLISVTTSITMVSGAAIYDALLSQSPIKNEKPQRLTGRRTPPPQTATKNTSAKKGKRYRRES